MWMLMPIWEQERQTVGQADRQTERETEADRQTDRQRHTKRQRDREKKAGVGG